MLSVGGGLKSLAGIAQSEKQRHLMHFMVIFKPVCSLRTILSKEIHKHVHDKGTIVQNGKDS